MSSKGGGRVKDVAASCVRERDGKIPLEKERKMK